MKVLKMILVFPLILLLVMTAELLVTLPFGMSANPTSEDLRYLVFWEMLLAAVPAGLITFFAAMALQLKTRRDTWIHAAVWTAAYLALDVVLSLFVNHNAALIFGTLPFYLLKLLFFCGPLVYAKIRRLE